MTHHTRRNWFRLVAGAGLASLATGGLAVTRGPVWLAPTAIMAASTLLLAVQTTMRSSLDSQEHAAALGLDRQRFAADLDGVIVSRVTARAHPPIVSSLIACFISVVIGIFPNFMMTFVKAVTG